MFTQDLNLRPVATSDLSHVASGVSLASEWPLYTIPKNRIAYKLYYYLLSISAFDQTGRHAYVSDRFWTKTKAAEEIGCTPRSITNNINTLVSLGVLERDDVRKAYVLPTPHQAAQINYNTIKTFLSLDG